MQSASSSMAEQRTLKAFRVVAVMRYTWPDLPVFDWHSAEEGSVGALG